MMESGMKTILLMVHDDPGQDARLLCALQIARAVTGHIVCLDLLRVPVVVDAFGAGASQAAVILDEREREDRLVDTLRARLKGMDISHEWARAQGEFEHSLAHAARLVDLVVMSSKDIPGLTDQGDLPARVARATAAPILVVPPDSHGFDLSGTAIVGWDGSATAGNAIRAAVPLLRLAGRVEILTIADGESDGDPADAAGYLARHGCNAVLHPLALDGNVGAQLRALLSRASWGVIGTYGHSRLRERLFGGTTRTLLRETPVPLLITR
jgi:nucleotide-binding universal stress UspA family protein